MRKIRFTIMAAAMAAIFITSGCVKNEESEGVKELRQGQAALLQARATATTMEAEAEAAYTMAQAAVSEAVAQMQLTYARQREIANELLEAENEIDIAELQLELEVLQATQESEIAVAVAEAEELLNAAEISLLESIRELEVAIAEDDNALLKEYLDLYKNAMAEVMTARGLIVDETATLAKYQIYVNGVGGDLVAEKQAEQENLEKDLALQELYKAKLEAVLENPAVTDEELLEAAEEVEKTGIEIAKLEAQKVKLNEASMLAFLALSDAGNLRFDVNFIVDFHPGVINNLTNTTFYSVTIDNEEFDPTISDDFYSKPWYEAEIASEEVNIEGWQKQIADLEVTLATQVAVYDIHAAKLAELYTVYVTAQEEYDAAEQAYQVAVAEWQADPSAANQTAMDDALIVRNDANTARADAETEHNDYESNYYNPALSDVEFTQVAISFPEDMIAGAQMDIAYAQANLQVVTDYIAFLQEELDEALLIHEDVNQAYKDAYQADVLAQDASDELDEQISDLESELNYAEDYLFALEGNYDYQIQTLDNINSFIADTKADMAEIDITFASWESAIEAQESKIEELEAELTYWQAVANDYKVMFEGEMGDE